MELGGEGKRVFAPPRVWGTALTVSAENFGSRRRAEGLRQWASLWNSALCYLYEDGLHSPRNKLALSSASTVVEYVGGGVGSRARKPVLLTRFINLRKSWPKLSRQMCGVAPKI